MINLKGTTLLLALGILLFGIGGIKLFQDLSLSSSGIWTQGTVVGINNATCPGRRVSSNVAVLEIQYTDNGGTGHVVTASSCPGASTIVTAYTSLYSKGDQISIRYSPDDPTQITLRDETRVKGDVFLIIVSLIIGLALVLWLILQRMRDRIKVEPQPAIIASIPNPSSRHHVEHHHPQRRKRTDQ